MTEENNQTQARVDAQLEAMREAMRALLNNPATPASIHNEIADTLTTWRDETCQGFIELDELWPRVKPMLLKQEMAEQAEPEAQPGDEGRHDVMDGFGPDPLPLSKIAYHRLSLSQIGEIGRAITQLMTDGGDEESHATDFAELLTTLSSAETPGELMSMVRHMWYRLAVELSTLREGVLTGYAKTYPQLRKVKPAKAHRPQVEAETAPDFSAIAGNAKATALMSEMFDLILGEQLPGWTLEQKFERITRKVKEEDGDAIRDRVSQIRSMLDKRGEASAAEPITPERAEEITAAVITLMRGPLPEKLSDGLHTALDDLASGPAVADTSANPDMLRVWLPTVLQQEKGSAE